MKSVRITANILYYLTKAASLLFLFTAVYAFVVLMLSLHSSSMEGLPIEIRDNKSFIIFFPFTNTPFLLGDYTDTYLVISTLLVALYGVFLWLLSGVFKAFKQQKLFTPKSVSRLGRFYLFNLLVPIICLISLSIAGQQIRDAVVIVFLHIMIGVFAFFMATIFKQGLVLQEEQDLTL